MRLSLGLRVRLNNIFIETLTDGNLFTYPYYSRHSVCPLRVFHPQSQAALTALTLINADPSVLLACIALYQTAFLSPNTCTHCRSTIPGSGVVLNLAPPPPHYSPSPPSFRSSGPPQFQSGTPNTSAQRSEPNTFGRMHITSVMPPEWAWTMCEAPVFIPADQIQAEFVPEQSISSLANESMEAKVD